MSNDNDISPPSPSPSDNRGTVSAEELQRIVGRALKSAEGQTTTVAGQAIEQERRAISREEQERHIAAQHARGMALIGQSRGDLFRSTATVALTTTAGGLLAGPLGALVGAGAGWLWDKFTDPHGR